MAVTATTQEEVFSFALPDEVLAKLADFTSAPVNLDVRDGLLFVQKRKRQITLQEMLDQCDPNAPISEEDIAWDRMRPVGRELL